ncbi:hypothetical protein LM602_06305 [Candidatus Acetothermia bacterium]|jgi:hypothetical protein|nr:hypothetical protein [Candidatus Acetothermia bacterium]MCI2432149.1 hypothetical protein [Candidatus Acetothermia bacterium]MCI2436158.1 hypothetical protein [Candidatus Acetothermia bacterium]
MQPDDRVIAQLDELIQEFSGLRKRSQYDDISDLPKDEVVRFVTRARAAIHRVAGKPSVYVDQCEEIMKHGGLYSSYLARQLVGVLDSLRADVSLGYLRSQRELLHGELFADFLEMAQHLLDEGYKDAAAVIAGSALEAHLRHLCQKANIPIEIKSGGGATPKKADRLNADLASGKVYLKLDQKNVTAWLDLRNKAAHGLYDHYSAGQVALLISGVRDFITRNPA